MTNAILLMGYGAMVLAILEFCWAILTAYRTVGGAIGQVPVLAMPIQAAVLLVVGLGIIGTRQPWAQMFWWQYVLTFVLSAALGIAGVVAVTRLRRSRL